MGNDVVGFDEIDRTRVALVGGKGAHLGELSRIEGVRVPSGFCVTTEAFARVVAREPGLARLLDRLSELAADDRAAIAASSAAIREAIEAIAVPDDLAASIAREVGHLGTDVACAVRSSATAEDLPTASFAGQQDSYLNVVGPAAVLEHVGRCWASLFTDRAVTYRLRNGFDHRAVHMAVVVQRLVVADSSGILFTADPVTGHRRVATIDAGFGLGDALVAGLVNPDRFEVIDGEIVGRAIATKQRATRPRPAGGTQDVVIDAGHQDEPALTDGQVLRLAALGRRIEAHLGAPQDIEWCLAGDEIWIVQSRPITTLFPVPETDDGANHVYVSVGHQQMMTDPFTPLGLSVWQMTTPRPMAEAGGRLFVDVTAALAAPASRATLVDGLGRSDPLIGDALRTVVEREGFIPPVPEVPPGQAPTGISLPSGAPDQIPTDPAIVTEQIERFTEAVAAARREIRTMQGPAVFDFIAQDIEQQKQANVDSRSLQAIMAGMEAAWWLNDRLQAWLGEKNLADTLGQSVPNNVTAEMGLALLDVADAVRPHPEVVAYLEQVEDERFLDGLAGVEGGVEARAALEAFLDRYGVRCVGEIDIARPRWRERPDALVPVILANVAQFEPGAAAARFERGRQEAEAKRVEVLERLRALPDGATKADETARMIDRVRTFAGYREHPKYWMVSRYFVYKQALWAEAERLVEDGVLREVDDCAFLRFDELREVVRTHTADQRLIERRKADQRTFDALTPPRVMTSDGEAVAASYRREDVPAGALVGLAVSSGTVEGRARIIHDMGEADLEPGDILVTAYTDPSWSPLFVAIDGLVTEVGGLMTHGAVVAREYGLPAVVGVEGATRLIRDGQRIRVHGTEGYVEVLPDR